MGYLDLDGLKIYYEIHGDGKPLVLIEGLAQKICMWKYQIEGLKDYFKVVVFDLRGGGKSDKPKTGYSVDNFADDTIKLIRGLNLKKPHILGVSLGGFIAQKVAIKYGDEIDKLVLVNTAYGGPNYIPPSIDVLKRMVTGGDAITLSEKAFNSLSLGFTKKFLKENKKIVKEIVKCLVRDPQPSYAYQGQSLAGANFNAENEVHKIENETLIIVGDEDRVVPKENGFRLKDKIKNSKIEVIKEAGHLCFIEKPQDFNEVVKNFLIGR